MSSDPNTPSVASSNPKRTGLVRFLATLAAVIVLVWSWNDSGMSESGKLWTNRDRAIDYIFGKPVDESTVSERRTQIERDIRTEFQAAAREDLEQEYAVKGEPSPGLMILMQRSQELAREQLEALPPGEFETMVEIRLSEDSASGGRRGGYFPPETNPRAIFGDPDALDSSSGFLGWMVSLANYSGPLRPGLLWILAAITGDGYTAELLETLAIAIWGTLLAAIAALPASVLAARRSMSVLFPGTSWFHRCGRWTGHFIVRRSFDVSRGFNEIVLAMIFVAVLGLGPLPGVMAILIHTFGVLGKVFADAIETVDPRPIEGVQSTGASGTQVVAFAILPQIMAFCVSQGLLRFESNVRGATILGVVGAGGIGQLLMDKFRAFEFQEVTTMMMIIIVVVTVIDFGCSRIMRRFV